MIRVMFKDPDGVYDAITKETERQVSALQGLTEEERESVTDLRREKIIEATSKWFEFGEYCMVEIDIEAGTARVVPVKEYRGK